eukprot:scaffold1882_cov181-Skeletonema_marinoi.AAC.2
MYLDKVDATTSSLERVSHPLSYELFSSTFDRSDLAYRRPILILYLQHTLTELPCGMTTSGGKQSLQESLWKMFDIALLLPSFKEAHHARTCHCRRTFSWSKHCAMIFNKCLTEEFDIVLGAHPAQGRMQLERQCSTYKRTRLLFRKMIEDYLWVYSAGASYQEVSHHFCNFHPATFTNPKRVKFLQHTRRCT